MTNEAFQALLACGPVLLDGATGSNLMRAGMPRGICTEVWVTEHPEPLLALQRDYIAAGSQIIYAPTFCANRRGLARCGRENDVALLNRQLVALSLEAADGHALVAGDLTTTGVPLEPAGTMTYHELFEIYTEQITALAEAGADLLVVETMLGIDEMTVALEAAQSVCALPVLCSMTVQADGSGYFGGTCVEAVETLQELGAAAVGINCSTGPDQLESLVRNMRQAAKVPLLVKPNAGMPEISPEGEAIYSMGPAAFAQHMRTLIDAGAALVGGCCGTDPRYISALRDADKVITVLKSYQPAAVSLVINMVRGDMLLSGEILSPKEIEEILKTPILGILPEEDDVFLNNLSDKTRAFKLLAVNLLSDRQKLYDVTRRYSGVIGNIRRILRKGL